MAWTKKRLGDVCTIINGKNQKDVIDINGKYPIFGSAGNVMGYANKYLCDQGTVIIGRKGNISTPIFIDEPFWNVDTAFGIYPKEKSMLPKFNYYQCLNIDFKSRNKGTTIPSLVKTDLLTIDIYTTDSIPEQQAIVEKLDFAFGAIEKAKANIEKNIENAKELFQSKLNAIFSQKGDGADWVLTELGKLGIITSSKRIYKSEYVTEGIPFYRTKEIKELSNGKNITLELFISEEKYIEIKNRFGVPQIGDILISAVGTIGEIMVIENDNEFYFKDGNIIWLKDFKNVNPNYLRYLLKSFVEKIKSLAIGAAYSALTIEKLNLYKVVFPSSIEKQQKIVNDLDELSLQTKLIQDKYKQKLANLEEFRKSILEKAFKGELI